MGASTRPSPCSTPSSRESPVQLPERLMREAQAERMMRHFVDLTGTGAVPENLPGALG